MLNFNVDIAVDCVKTISDHTQCVTCDELIGPCVRFLCGHSTCEGCAEKAGECLFCVSSPTTYLSDEPQSARLTNAAALLTAFQDSFNIDVYKRQRISNHLRIEKLIFPECIQAPNKYCNKRRSLNISLQNKENNCKTIFPGEEVIRYNTLTMKKSHQHVQNWLNQNEIVAQNLPRRPFKSIDVNTETSHKNNKKNVQQSMYKKRHHLKSIHKTSSLLCNLKNNSEKKNNHKEEIFNKQINNFKYGQITHKCDKNEVSSVHLEDEIIVNKNIKVIDKDQQAWLSILTQSEKEEIIDKEALKENKPLNKEPPFYNMVGAPITSATESKKIGERKVLFFKLSPLFETCKLCCNDSRNQIISSCNIDKSNDISIVIDNSAFITTIQFTHCEEHNNENYNKSSVAIQTDEEFSLLQHENITINESITPQKRKNELNDDNIHCKMMKDGMISECLDELGTGKQISLEKGNNYQKTTNENCYSLSNQKCLIIEDSDADSNISCNNIHEVEVEVHTVESGILNTLTDRKYQQRTKRQVRGHTPNSSNSSDKENVDPNRIKARKLVKKYKNKK